MSRLFMNTTYLDEANGNTLLTHPSASTQATGTVVTLDQVSPTTTSSSTTTTLLANETLIIQSPSNDDLSQSLSEYTDADESISAPTELLAEFLSAVMLRDYVNALKYCKLILQYEPNNSTARDFYPHILSKIASEANNGSGGGSGGGLGTDQQSGESDENYNFNYSTSSSNSDDINIDEVVMICSSESEQSSNCSSYLDYSNSSSNGSSGGGSSGGEELDEQALNRINSNSTESDQLPPSQSATDNNTSHSYSSLLLEEEEKDLTLSDISNLNIEDDENDSGDGPDAAPSFTKQDSHQSLIAAQSTKAQPPSTTASATSSPKSQPLASKIVAMLRARVIPSRHYSTND